MWMAYKEEFAAYDIRSAMEAAYDCFKDLAFDDHYKADYGMGMFIPNGVKYSNTADICCDYLNSKLCKTCLVHSIHKIDFASFTDDMKKFLHQTDAAFANKYIRIYNIVYSRQVW